MRFTRTARLLASAAALAASALCLTTPQAVAAPAGSAAVSATANCMDTCVLGVRAATHSDHDRLVIDLGAGPIPQWSAGVQVGGNLTMGEGAVMPIQGDEYLKLYLHRATTFDFTTSTPVYTSPLYQTYAFPSLKGQGQFQYVDSSVREFHMGLALGDYSSYKVFALTAPNRIVVDVYH
ncbi:AMIN-like domain-containing (lipo)protein [Streptomyces fragilis]|uniref:AMIN-like domain-containing protein n=1 Tax=Streptomyces fragilis TaxID=67301 RepID=A0ABV2YAA0_9ACTN|nr:hypothetical protein [Streptomyces fragilis]